MKKRSHHEQLDRNNRSSTGRERHIIAWQTSDVQIPESVAEAYRRVETLMSPNRNISLEELQGFAPSSTYRRPSFRVLGHCFALLGRCGLLPLDRCELAWRQRTKTRVWAEVIVVVPPPLDDLASASMRKKLGVWSSKELGEVRDVALRHSRVNGGP